MDSDTITAIGVYGGIALLTIGLIWQLKGWAVLFLLTAALGYGTYVAYDLGGVDNVTAALGLLTVVGALAMFFGGKKKLKAAGKKKATAAAAA